MPINDNSLVMMSEQAVTSTGDATPTNNAYVADLNAYQDFGHTDADIRAYAECAVAPTSSGSATVAAVLQDSADGSSWADVIVGTAIAYGSIVAGTVLLNTKLPQGLRQYKRVTTRVATAALTAGKFTTRIQLGQQRNTFRPRAV